MASTDRELVADCVKLWQAGEQQLKPLAEHYRNVVSAIMQAEPGLSGLGRDPMLGGPYGPFRDAWQKLADDFVRTLQTTSENMNATGDVPSRRSGPSGRSAVTTSTRSRTKASIDAQSVDGLLDQIRDALKKLAEEVNRKEREIADAMITAADSLAKGKLLFEPARPALADVSRADLTTKLGLGEHP